MEVYVNFDAPTKTKYRLSPASIKKSRANFFLYLKRYHKKPNRLGFRHVIVLSVPENLPLSYGEKSLTKTYARAVRNSISKKLLPKQNSLDNLIINCYNSKGELIT